MVQVSYWELEECDDDYTNPTLNDIIKNITDWSPIPVYNKDDRGTSLFIPSAK